MCLETGVDRGRVAAAGDPGRVPAQPARAVDAAPGLGRPRDFRHGLLGENPMSQEVGGMAGSRRVKGAEGTRMIRFVCWNMGFSGCRTGSGALPATG